MIKVLTYTHKKMVWGTLRDLDNRSNITWVDCLNPTKEELFELSKHTCVNLDDIKETLDPEERPRITEYKDYTVIAFKSPFYKGNQVITITIGIIILKYGIVTLRTHEIKAIHRLESLTENQKITMFEKGPSFILYRLLVFIIEDYFVVMDAVEESLDKIENRIFKGTHNNIMKDIFKIKKTLIYFHKALTANREVIVLMDKEFVKELNRNDVRRFRTLYNDMNELVDIESTYKDIATSQVEIYLTQQSNNLNAVMKKLTALASFILIPTLIAGVYGMNFVHMPELEWRYGYFFILGFMIVSVLLLYLYFKKKLWL